ncbi:acetylcholinesterase-like [Saccostrea echinata]|uniref:acetylcholinesterase-like n=1 Tax=Saccostrea echinata TaxID=191078 RepID=UPI002A837A02|nr:acetylcholinesterase-like [Saccostrea echinata]
MLSVCSCFVVLCFHLCMSKEDLIRQTTYGRVRGFVTERVPGKQIYTFLGIPYASPPVKELRFERPVSPIPWRGVLDALTLPPACIQYDHMDYIQDHFEGFHNSSEDCLYINLYIPPVKSNKIKNTSVLVYMHGGSNRDGMGSMLEGDILAGHGEIIVVTFNYRLGIYGFVAAKDEGLEGNYGFLDQVEVLKWVKANIEEFGGNPDMVTIYGHSAGAADVGFHGTSPLSKGLFQRVIVHSGSPLAFWATTDPGWPEGYNILPCKGGCNGKTFKQHLKSLSIKELNSKKGLGTPRDLVTFPANIDGEFLIGRPSETYHNHLNADHFLLAFAKDEGFPLDKEINRDIFETFSKGTMMEVLWHYNTVYKNIQNFTEIVFKEYKEFEGALRYIQLQQVDADFIFFAPMIRLADLLCRYIQDLYLLSFDHVSTYSPHPNWQGVPHGVDLLYVFGVPLVGHHRYKYDELDKEASRRVMTIWSDFVKGKDHGLSPYQERNKQYSRLVSRNEKILIETANSFRPRKMHFWNKLIPHLNKTSTRRAIEVKLNHHHLSGVYNSSTVSHVKWLVILICWTWLFVLPV